MGVSVCVWDRTLSCLCTWRKRQSFGFLYLPALFFLHVGLSVYQQLETSAIPDRQQSGSYYLHPRTFNSLVRARVREMYCKTEFLNRCLQGCSGSELKSLNFKCKHLTQWSISLATMCVVLAAVIVYLNYFYSSFILTAFPPPSPSLCHSSPPIYSFLIPKPTSACLPRSILPLSSLKKKNHSFICCYKVRHILSHQGWILCFKVIWIWVPFNINILGLEILLASWELDAFFVFVMQTLPLDKD